MENDPYRTRHSLIERVKNPQDGDSWEEFLDNYKPFIVFLLGKFGVKSQDIDEFTQKIIVKCWEKIETYTLQEKSGKFRAWLKTIIRHEIINEQRRHIMIKKKMEEIKLEQKEETGNKIDEYIEQEWNEYISKLAWENISKQVNESHLDIFKRFAAGQSAQDISKELDIGINTLYTTNKRVMEKMMAELQRLTEKFDR